MSAAPTNIIHLNLSAAPSPAMPETRASLQAKNHYAANLAALRTGQPTLADRLSASPPQLEWLYARDGVLSARGVEGNWLANCSLPGRVAVELLPRLDSPARVSLMLFPTHAAQVRRVLDLLPGSQAVIVLVSTDAALAEMFGCVDFSPDLGDGRALFLAGDDWSAQLESTLRDRPGMPPPQQYIRTSLLSEQLGTRVMEAAGAIIEADVRRRATLTVDLRAALRPDAAGPFVLLADSQFRPWDFATPQAMQLWGRLPAERRRMLNIDHPSSSSLLAMLEAVQGAAAVFSTQAGRGGLPESVPVDLPVVTWLLTGPVPAAATAGGRDGLILASRRLLEAARSAGWPAERILLAQPELPIWAAPGRTLGIIADAGSIAADEREFTMSSHRLLFEAIAGELVKDPFALGGDVMEYLKSRAGQLGLEPRHLDLPLFVEQLILPAYARGIAGRLVAAGLPVRLYGAGWDQIESLARCAAGPVASREQLIAALAECAAVVDVWPIDWPPPLQLTGRAVLRTRNAREQELLRGARQAATAEQRVQSDGVEALDGGRLEQFIQGLWRRGT